MFRKEFKIKNNCQLKNSERKKLLSLIMQSFTGLSESELLESFPTKESVHQMKLVAFRGEHVTVYICKGCPLILECDQKVLPTVYFLWAHPNILFSYIISSYVLEKLASGADLMVPGIVITDEAKPYGSVRCGETVSINVTDNRASVAVGIALMSSEDMIRTSGRGKAVAVIHTIGDGLFKLASEKIEMPYLLFLPNPTNDEEIDIDDQENTSEDPSPSDIKDHVVDSDCDSPTKDITLDDALMNAFLQSIKTCYEKSILPILTNVFYKHYILKALPSYLDFDIKKTQFKKLSTFLAKMESEGIIQLETSAKNVQSVIGINSKHPMLKDFIYLFDVTEEPADKEPTELNLEIIEYYIVNSRVEYLFNKLTYRKGDQMVGQEVKKVITNYVKTENLQHPIHKELIVLDPTLSKIIQLHSESVDWKCLIDKITGIMGKAYEVRKKGALITSGKGNIPCIEISVKTKNANKKVTIVDHVNVYGVDINELSKKCQVALAASTSVTKVPGKKTLQFQIQGNHVSYINKLFIEKYAIPKKYIIEHGDCTKK